MTVKRSLRTILTITFVLFSHPFVSIKGGCPVFFLFLFFVSLGRARLFEDRSKRRHHEVIINPYEYNSILYNI